METREVIHRRRVGSWLGSFTKVQIFVASVPHGLRMEPGNQLRGVLLGTSRIG